MANLNTIDEAISYQITTLQTVIEGLEFVPYKIFNLNDLPVESITTIRQDLRYPGVYLIDVKVNENHTSFKIWSEEFLERWEHEEYRERFTPNSRQVRLKAHMDNGLPEWIPLYLGRCKDIGSRVKGHIDMKLLQPTTGMKLLARENMQHERFRLSTIKIEVSSYNVIMPEVEKHLRNKINPILGRQ